MDRHHWIVSDPPHGDVDLDEASRLLGLAKAETRIKVNFGAPEVWLAYAHEEEASASSAELQAAGLSAPSVPAANLLDVPPPTPVKRFVFADEHLEAHTEEGEVHLRYDVSVIGSYCKPPTGFSASDSMSRQPRPSMRSAVGLRSKSAFVDEIINLGRSPSPLQTVELLERRTNLDLYYAQGSEVRRLSIAEGVADFSGMGGEKRPRLSDNMDTCVAECERRFPKLFLDKRLMNVRPRRRLTVGDPTADPGTRKLFAFGTIGLQSLLADVSPDFADITQFELGSRLAFLLRSGKDPGWATKG